jgi:hypothetical protein
MLKIFIFAVFIGGVLVCLENNASAQILSDPVSVSPKDKKTEHKPCYAIRRVPYPVTKISKDQKLRYALLDICPADKGMVSRPLLYKMEDGKPVGYEYDIVKAFKNKKEAEKYAKENKIEDVQI